MKKLLFGIFAHPDDEAFGPAGSLCMAAKDGVDVHLLLVTDGGGGMNPDKVDDLASQRLSEWQASCDLIGTTSNYALHYKDSTLCNQQYLQIAQKILKRVQLVISGYHEPLTADFMTFEPSGVTGHLDHIAVSYITTYVFEKLANELPSQASPGKLKYYCLAHSLAPKPNTKWLYMPGGAQPEEVDEIVDFSEVADQRLAVMKTHVSQRQDMQENLETRPDSTNKDCHCDHFRYFKG